MILMLFVPFRARFMVARDHQIPFRGARPDRHSPAFAFDGHCDSSQHQGTIYWATALVNHQMPRNLHDLNYLLGG